MKKQKKGYWLFNQIISLPTLNKTDKIILSSIYYLKHNGKDLHISNRKLAKSLGLASSTTDNSIKKLIDLGYIQREGNIIVATQSNIYNSTDFIFVDPMVIRMELKPNLLILLSDIISYVYNKGSYFKENKTIAKQLGISTRTVSNVITNLSELELISIVIDGKLRTLSLNMEMIRDYQPKKKVAKAKPMNVKPIQPIIKKEKEKVPLKEKESDDQITQTDQRKIPKYDLPIGYNIYTLLKDNNLNINNNTYKFLLALGNIEDYLLGNKIAVIEGSLRDGTPIPSNLILDESVFQIMN